MRLFLASLAVAAALAAGAAPARAGTGPENVLLVVNADSPASLQVAHHYVQLRGVPASHVCPVRGIPALEVIGIDVFRERIWKPVQEFIAAHGLAEEIDVVAYSADFPFGVDFSKEFEGAQLPQLMDKFRVASLTGITYLGALAGERSREWLDMKPNNYWRWDDYGTLLPGHGFSSRYVWNLGEAEPKTRAEEPDKPYHYVLSTLLGFTGQKGNTVPEVLQCLARAAACDGTAPDGTVYLMHSTDNLRSGPRRMQFPPVVERLAALGRKGVVLEAGQDGQDGKLPIGRDDVMGCVAGVAGFDWTTSKSTMLPGAIAEHLTSFGGRFDGSGQTKISEFIRAGAAGSSGAVAEPFNHPYKFPAASLHVHYAEGCSLAESFYQSFATPYQMIVVGDPLARPYAHFAKVALAEPSPKAAWKGTVEVRAQVEPAQDRPVARVELWVDGQRLAEGAPDAALALDTTTLLDGEHELRLVAVEAGSIETHSGVTERVQVANGDASVTIKGPRKPEEYGDELELSGRAPKAEEVSILWGEQVLATVKPRGASWKVALDTTLLGVGRATLQARADYGAGAQALSPLLDVEVREPGPAKPAPRHRTPKRKGTPTPKGGGKPGGLEATVKDAQGKEHTGTIGALCGRSGAAFAAELQKLAKGKIASVRLAGELQVGETGFYRFALAAAGDLVVRVGGQEILSATGLAADRQVFAACRLEAGWQPVEIEYTPSGDGRLDVWLGGAQVQAALDAKALRH